MRSIVVKIWVKFGRHKTLLGMDGYDHFELFGMAKILLSMEVIIIALNAIIIMTKISW